MCVYLESNQGPLSYQDSVLPLNYTRICKQFIYFYFWRTTHLYGYIRTAFYHSTIHACVNNLFIFIWDNNLFRSVKLWSTRRIVPQKRLARATAKSLWAKFLTRPLILSIRAGKKFCVLFCGSYSWSGSHYIVPQCFLKQQSFPRGYILFL